ncbi:MAG TPA: alpha-hydroxy acid oxidase [Geminicoccaceae bacterium]|nr:alpha-hydroxy acid oxidase [Geminicoccaceae bacterium]
MDQGRLEREGYSVAALREIARRRLPRMVFDFCDGGAEDEITRRRNEDAFADWEFLPTPLNGTSARDQSILLFGERLSLPVLIGPTGLSGMLWPQGEVAAARAAAAAGTLYTMSHASTVAIEKLAQATSGPLWFQNFMYRDRGVTRAFAERAQAAGYRALVLTIDNQVLGQRERDLRNGFVIPPRVTWRSVADVARALPWALRMARAPITMANYVSEARKDIVSLGAYVAGLLDPTLNWKDVDWLRGLWRGPLLLKGVLHPDEARLAIEHGMDGIIVSNHGGRQLDTALPSIRALPAVADAVAGRMPLLLDGGVRRGSHVIKAIALGATACLIGRPHLWGLALGGEAGVAQVLEIFRRDIDRVLALGGWDGIDRVDLSVLAQDGVADAALTGDLEPRSAGARPAQSAVAAS